MSKGFYERRKVRRGDFEYLLDDTEQIHAGEGLHTLTQWKIIIIFANKG